MTLKNLVSTEWLNQHLHDDDVRVLHSSYYLGVPGHSPMESYLKGHIPGALLFDIDEICDHSNPLPHMLPAPDLFAGAMGALGVSNKDHVVIYDDGGVRPAFRVWWTFKAFGHENVSVLDGGLMKWAKEGRPLTRDVPSIKRSTYQANLLKGRVKSKTEVLENLKFPKFQVLDARGPGRFSGADTEPRPGMKTGHIPGAKNLYYGMLFNEDGTLKSETELKDLVAQVNLQEDTPVVTSCGSGVTASILYYILDLLGFENLAVYDGSWAEWGTSQDTPIEKS